MLTQMPIDSRVVKLCREYGGDILANWPEWSNLAVWLGDMDNELCSWLFADIEALEGGHPWSYSCSKEVARKVFLSVDKPYPHSLAI